MVITENSTLLSYLFHDFSLFIKTITTGTTSGTGLLTSDMDVPHKHWGKADDRNCNYGQPKMAHVESGKNLFCRLNCFYNVF
jgi:hypothetical protein